MKQFRLRNAIARRDQTGAALLIIIIGMVVLATLGIAMYTLTYTANMNQVIAQRAARASYLSESGIRIAASEYNAATLKNAKLVELHNKQFTMPDNVGKITIQSNPYWFYANANISSLSNPITLYLPGGVPPADETNTALTFPTKGYLKVRDVRTIPWINVTFVEYDNSAHGGVSPGTFVSTPNGGTPVTFYLTSPFADDIVIGDEFYIGNASYTTVTAPSGAGGNLTLNYTDINTAKLFPSQKGSIFVIKNGISYYKYDMRIISTTANTVKLVNMQPISGAPTPNWQLNLLSGDQVYVGRVIGFTSNGTFGD